MTKQVQLISIMIDSYNLSEEKKLLIIKTLIRWWAEENKITDYIIFIFNLNKRKFSNTHNILSNWVLFEWGNNTH